MPRQHSASRLGKGLQAGSLVGHAVAGSDAGRALVAELRARYPSVAPPVVGMSHGRVVVFLRGAGLANRTGAEQVAEAGRIAATTRTHLAAGPWYTRRLVGRALTAVYEDHGLEGECDVLRYVECTVLAND